MAGSSASLRGAEPSSIPASSSNPAVKRAARPSIGACMISKSSGSAPEATPMPTRPGKRAANHAISSATSAGGRNGRSNGQGAAHPPAIASRHHPAACNGFGR